MNRKRLTDIMREMGLIDEKQIQMALRRQYMVGARVGTQLVQLGFITEDQLGEALSRLYGVPHLTMEDLHGIDDGVKKLVPRELVEKYKILPVRRTGKIMTLAMVNPGDLELIQDLEFRLGSRIEVLVCPEVTMELGLHMHYGIETKKEYVTLLDEEGRVQLERHAKEALRGSRAPHMGFRDLKASLKDSLFSAAAHEVCLARNTRDAVCRVLKAARSVVQRVDLYLVRRSEGIIKKWTLPAQPSNSDLRESNISLPEVSGLMEQLEQGRFFFGERSSVPGQRVVNQFGASYAKWVFFSPITVGGRMPAVIYADNGQRVMTASHVQDLLGFSVLVNLALRLDWASRRGSTRGNIPSSGPEVSTRVEDGRHLRSRGFFEPEGECYVWSHRVLAMNIRAGERGAR